MLRANASCVSESTIIAEQSTIVADGTLTRSDGPCPKHAVQTLSRVYCKDCEPASKYTSSMMESAPAELREPETSTIYHRDRVRRSRTGKVEKGGGENELTPN